VAVTARVSIVGAGPGDPGLLTRRAAALLRAADLVLFDALVDDRVLKLARRAQRFYVGKRAGRHALSQPEIHAMMIRAARRGRRVVRLKGGDPFVFGRGGEEALALREAGVPFEIVPGVTSMIAAPALAGIPLTHRGVAASVFITSGHDEDAFRVAISGLAPAGLTLVIAMGYARRTVLASQLLAAGWSADTPAAVVAAASLPDQQVWRGTIATMASGASHVEGDHAALLIVGDVAALALSDWSGTVSSTGRVRDDQESAEIQPARFRER
jgi:uroporphyrin-III C-methyltransferase